MPTSLTPARHDSVFIPGHSSPLLASSLRSLQALLPLRPKANGVGKKRKREESTRQAGADENRGDAGSAATTRKSGQRPGVKDVEELDVDEFLQSGLFAGGEDDGEAAEADGDNDGLDEEQDDEDDDEDDPLVLETGDGSNGRVGLRQ